MFPRFSFPGCNASNVLKFPKACLGGLLVDIHCDKGDHVRFKSDVLGLNQMSELLSKSFSTRKSAFGYFNALFDLSGAWLNDVADAKHLAFDGYFISLYYLHLTTSQLVLQERVRSPFLLIGIPHYCPELNLRTFWGCFLMLLACSFIIGQWSLKKHTSAVSVNVKYSSLSLKLTQEELNLLKDGVKNQPPDPKVWS